MAEFPLQARSGQPQAAHSAKFALSHRIAAPILPYHTIEFQCRLPQYKGSLENQPADSTMCVEMCPVSLILGS